MSNSDVQELNILKNFLTFTAYKKGSLNDMYITFVRFGEQSIIWAEVYTTMGEKSCKPLGTDINHNPLSSLLFK